MRRPASCAGFYCPVPLSETVCVPRVSLTNSDAVLLPVAGLKVTEMVHLASASRVAVQADV